MLSKTPFEVPPYLLEKAKALPRTRMAVAGADNKVVLESARQATDAGVIEPILVGDADLILSISNAIGWNVSDIETVNVSGGEEEASNVAVSFAAEGRAEAVMKGHIHTETLMRSVLAGDNGLRTERRISHVFHMTIPGRDRVLMITDGSINVHPSVNAKMDIVKNAVELAHALGNGEPKVAMLSGAETVNASMPSSVEAEEVVKRVQAGEITDCIIDGPLAFDNAISPMAAKMKGIESPVAGEADILVVPNIETGNGLFKMMVYFMSGLAAGIVLGAKVPIVLTSRADPPEARFAAAILAAIVVHSD